MIRVFERALPDLARGQRVARFRRWWMENAPRGEFWALVIATLLFNLGMSTFMFLYNLFLLDLGFREQSLGAFSSALALGGLAGTIPMGVLARRFGTKRILSICLLLMAAAYGAKACLLWYSAQLALSFLDGVMLCGWVVCLSPAVASAVEEHKRPFAFSVLYASAVGACSLGGFVGGHVPGWYQSLVIHYSGGVVSGLEGKRITLLAACAMTGLAVLPVLRVSGGGRVQEMRWPDRPSPFLLRFLIASACWGAAIGAFNPFTGVFFARYLGVQTAQLGSFFSVAQLVQAGTLLFVPLILRRTGMISGILLMQLATAAALGLLAGGRNLLEMQVIYIGFMSAQHMCEPAIQSLLMDRVSERDRSTATSMSYLVVSLAQAGAAALAGFAFFRFGYPAVLLGVAIAAVGAAVIFRVLCGPSREPILTRKVMAN